MATNTQLLATLGRLIAQATGGLFDPTDRLAHLNAAYALAQARVIEVRPQEFLSRWTAHIAVGTDGTRARYQRPTNEQTRSIEIKGSSSTTAQYRQMGQILSEQALVASGDIVSFTDGTVRGSFAYYVEGSEIVIVPTPSENVTAGLRATIYEVLTLSSVDGDVPRLPESLHRLLAYGAAVYALEETKDAADDIVQTYRQRWASKFGPFEGSTEASREALAMSYRQHEPRLVVGMHLG